MPDTATTVLSSTEPVAVPDRSVHWRPVTYRRPIKRFIEAGALAWVDDIEQVPADCTWVVSLECCALVTGQAAALASRRLGLRQAVLTWENDPRQPLYSLPPYRGALRRTLAQADLFIAMIASAADHLRVLGVDDRRIAVVKPGADLSLWHPAEQPVAEPIVLFVSPLAANKGIDRLLQAWPAVRAAVPEARLQVMGDGPLAAMVRDAADVEYLGTGDAAAVAAQLRAAAVFCTAPRANSKWSEQFGLAYLEAMASGLPVVTTATGTNDEIVTAANPRVVDRPEALAAALIELLKDPGARAEVGAANRRYVEEHHDARRQEQALADAFAAVEQSG